MRTFRRVFPVGIASSPYKYLLAGSLLTTSHWASKLDTEVTYCWCYSLTLWFTRKTLRKSVEHKPSLSTKGRDQVLMLAAGGTRVPDPCVYVGDLDEPWWFGAQGNEL